VAHVTAEAKGSKKVASGPSRRALWVNEWREKSLEVSSNGDAPIPGVCVRVARKGLTRHGVRKSGRQRTYKEAFLRFGATDEFPKGYATPGVLQKESRHGGQAGSC
jgi:hypothetical protein